MRFRFMMPSILAILVAFSAPSATKADIIDLLPDVVPVERFLPKIEQRTITFSDEQLLFSLEDKEALRALALRLRGKKDRIVLTSHAGTAQMSSHDAVKLSYQRALVIRNFLLRHGVDPKQVDVEALGAPVDDGPTDRVVISALGSPD